LIVNGDRFLGRVSVVRSFCTFAGPPLSAGCAPSQNVEARAAAMATPWSALLRTRPGPDRPGNQPPMTERPMLSSFLSARQPSNDLETNPPTNDVLVLRVRSGPYSI